MKKIIIILIVFQLFSLRAFAATTAFVQGVSMITTTRSTTSTTYTVTEDRKPIWHYDAAAFSNVSAVYIELNGRVDATATGSVGLHNNAGTLVTGAEATATQVGALNSRTRSGDILANLVDGTDYYIKYKTTASTFRVDSVKIIIVQSGAITATETSIEMGERLNATATYANPTSYAEFVYTAAEYDGTVTILFEATLKPSNSARTVYAQLYDVTGAAAVTGSEVTHTGNTTTTRKRSGAITLTDGRTYRVQVKGDSGTAEDITATRLIIQQTGTPTKTAVYFPVLNTNTSGTGTTFTNQDREMLFDASSWIGSVKDFYYEATLKVSVGAETGSYQFYNETDAAQVGVVTSTATAFSRVRSSVLTMPTDDSNDIDGGRKVSVGAETINVSRSFLVALITYAVDVAAGGGADDGIIWFETED